jgi:hypothetical protein
VNQHTQAADEDNQEDNEPVRPPTTTWQQTPLSIFDFSSSHWKDHYEKWARISYDEELAL